MMTMMSAAFFASSGRVFIAWLLDVSRGSIHRGLCQPRKDLAFIRTEVMSILVVLRKSSSAVKTDANQKVTKGQLVRILNERQVVALK